MDMHNRPRIDFGFIDPFAIKEIVNKENFNNFLSVTRDICDPDTSYHGVGEEPIPVNLDKLHNPILMHVKPGSSIPKHAHDGPVFRLITAGEAVVNDKTYKEGDWMVIPSNFPYGIETPKGYTALWICGKC